MIIIGVLFAILRGNVAAITEAALDSSKEAVTLCITMIGVMSFWSGIMEIATKAGVIQMLSKVLRPFIKFMFPGIPEKHRANEHITTNVIANILG
jgi:spore maturation protein A